MTTATNQSTRPTFTGAPSSTVIVRDESWLVTSIERATGDHFVHVLGLSELVRDTEAVFSTAIGRCPDGGPFGDPRRRRRVAKLRPSPSLTRGHVPQDAGDLTDGGVADVETEGSVVVAADAGALRTAPTGGND